MLRTTVRSWYFSAFKIGDTHEPWIKGDAEVSVTFQMSTGTQARQVNTSKVLGTFKGIKKNSLLHPTGVLLLPQIKVQDHLSIAIDAIELDQHEYFRISKPLKLINNAIQKVPIPGLDSASFVINSSAGTKFLHGIVLTLFVRLLNDHKYLVNSSTLASSCTCIGVRFRL